MRTIILLAFGLVWAVSASAQVGSSISADGSAPNNNAMLDVQSPATGDGKGILIPRVTGNQRTNANVTLAGGLLDNSGNLRGGAAQGLIVYQTDGTQGLYFNTSQSPAPAWVYLGTEIDPMWASASNAIVADIAGRLSSNVWSSAGSTTNYLPRTGGTMSGALNMGAQMVTNVAHIDFNGGNVSVGRGANGTSEGAAVGFSANGSGTGAALGYSANGYLDGAAVGRLANGSSYGVAVGYLANGYFYGAAVGRLANGYDNGAAVGREANGTNYGAAVGYLANGAVTGVAVGASANGYNNGAAVGSQAVGTNYGAAMGRAANGSGTGAALGYQANGFADGAALGYQANGYFAGAAVGFQAKGTNYGVAIGQSAEGQNYGVAVGRAANGITYGAAVGYASYGYNYGAAVGGANGADNGAAMGYATYGNNYGVAVGRAANGATYGAAVGASANGAQTNVAIGARANAQGGTQRIAIGNNVTNDLDGTARIRGNLYLDGGTSIYTNGSFGSSAWGVKTFTIDHPLDPENKVLRHYCLEGPQVWNVYAGNAQLVNGQATVQLPDYYPALNLSGSEIYSLTPVGALVQIAVGAKVSENRFVIIGENDVEVSWTIKVLRNDPGCLEDLKMRPVEQYKNELR